MILKKSKHHSPLNFISNDIAVIYECCVKFNQQVKNC